MEGLAGVLVWRSLSGAALALRVRTITAVIAE